MTAIFQRYLRLLGIEGCPSGLSGLRTLVQRHLSSVPFENASKLLRYDRGQAAHAISLLEFLDGIELSDLGGTCFSNNPFLMELLRELGYDANLHGADMGKPNVHTCVRVTIDSVDYHVDVGFAAPFREPIRLDRLPYRIEEGENHYVFDRDTSSDGFRMDMFSGGEFCFGYVVHDPQRSLEFFDQGIVDSFALSSTFMQCLRISRVFSRHSVDLIDTKLYRHEAGETTVTILNDISELNAAIQHELGMPRFPVDSAVAILEGLTGRPFFEGDN